jgi:phosphoglycolate phosphatase
MLRPIVVFDLDGTLIETADDLLFSLNHVLGQNDLPGVERDELRRYVGQGGRVMLKRAFAAGGRAFNEDVADRLVQQFVAHYGDNMPGASAPFASVMEQITRLKAAGFAIAICTNKTETLAKKLIHLLKIADQFDAICGADTFPFKKPDPGHLLMTIEAAGGDPARAVMVGDSAADINAAKAAHVPVIAVDFGYTDVPVAELGPDRIISHFDEMSVAVIEEMIGQQAG